MDNQHKLIKGYRDLSQDEINLMNEVKAMAEKVGDLVAVVYVSNSSKYNELSNIYLETDSEEDEDVMEAAYDAVQWTEEAKRDLQVGFMKLVRSIAKPTTF